MQIVCCPEAGCRHFKHYGMSRSADRLCHGGKDSAHSCKLESNVGEANLSFLGS